MKLTNLGLTGLAIIVLALVVTALIFVGLSVSYYNSEINLRTQVEAKSLERDAIYDNTWKIISQQGQVASKYEAAFKEIYPLLMGERYREGEAQLAKLVLESNPKLETRLYEKLMDSIEAQRTTFTRTQKELIDINREHTLLITRFPASLFFSIVRRDKINIVIITSDKTKDASTTGKENDIQVF